MKQIDARGLACPAPVLKVKQALESGEDDQVLAIVDNAASRENVSRFLQSQGFTVTVEQKASDFHIVALRTDAPTGMGAPIQCDVPPEKRPGERMLTLIASDRLGSGDDALGAGLMVNFIKTLKEIGPDLWRLVFLNSGVKLTIDTSPVLQELMELDQSGVSILVCGTCLNHFNLLEKKKVGETTNMLDIVTSLQLADKVIRV